MGFLFVCFANIEQWQEDIYFSLNQQILALNILGGFHCITDFQWKRNRTQCRLLLQKQRSADCLVGML